MHRPVISYRAHALPHRVIAMPLPSGCGSDYRRNSASFVLVLIPAGKTPWILNRWMEHWMEQLTLGKVTTGRYSARWWPD